MSSHLVCLFGNIEHLFVYNGLLCVVILILHISWSVIVFVFCRKMGGALSAPVTTLHIDRAGNEMTRAATVSMQGWRVDMEDAHNMALKLNDQGAMLFGVYDGHGGAKAAKYLSEVVPNAFKQLPDLTDTATITELMLRLDKDFINQGLDDGSTCCIVVALPWNKVTNAPISLKDGETIFDVPDAALKCISVNIGDSRAMIVRSDGEWIAMTRDHKPNDENERARIVNAWGHVTSNRVDGNLALSRAIGDAIYKNNPNFTPEKQKVIAVPEYQAHYLFPGDLLLVCCDGIFEADVMTYEAVASIAYNSAKDLSKQGADWDPAIVGRDLIEQSLLKESRDNHTAMVIHFAKGTNYVGGNTPEREVIPGPYSDSDDSGFKNAYVADLTSNGYTMEDVRPLIDALDSSADGKVKGIRHVPPANNRTAGGFDAQMMNHFIQLLSSGQIEDGEEDDF